MAILDTQDGRSQLRIDTNYGYIELWCEELELIEPEHRTK